MKKSNRPAWPVIFAALMVCVAFAFTLTSITNIAFERKQLENRRVELQALQKIQAELGSKRTAIAGLLAGGADTPFNLPDLMRARMPGVAPDLMMRESTQVDGRELQRYDIRLEEVKSEELAAFLEACAANRPPARVVSLAVSPSRQGANGRVQAQLTVIAVR